MAFAAGFNCAESTNFATKTWIKHGAQADCCICRNDTVNIDMRTFISYADKATKKIIEENFVSDADSGSESDSEEEDDESSASGSEGDEDKSDDTTHPKRKGPSKANPTCSQKGKASRQSGKRKTDDRSISGSESLFGRQSACLRAKKPGGLHAPQA